MFSLFLGAYIQYSNGLCSADSMLTGGWLGSISGYFIRISLAFGLSPLLLGTSTPASLTVITSKVLLGSSWVKLLLIFLFSLQVELLVPESTFGSVLGLELVSLELELAVLELLGLEWSCCVWSLEFAVWSCQGHDFYINHDVLMPIYTHICI